MTVSHPPVRVNKRDPLNWIEASLEELRDLGLDRQRSQVEGPHGVVFQRNGRLCINWGCNDYLGLATDPRLATAVAEAATEVGWGAGASPLVCGRNSWHARLEAQLSRFEGAPATLLFTSGFAANVGTVASLVGAGDALYSDAKNHASLIDGCRLSRADVHIYPHGDVQALAKLLRESVRYRRRMIVTDSLFSMDGDLAPLPELAALAAEFDALLLVDEAHATGVFGAQGRGVSEALGVEDEVHVRVGTLSKGLGSVGGFVSGSQRLIEWLATRARPYVYSTAPPPALCAAAVAALTIIEEEPERRQQLQARSAWLRDELTDRGWQVAGSASQIIPLRIGDPRDTMALAARLEEHGHYVPGIRPPTVPAGESLLRLSLCWGHTDEMVAQLFDVLGSRRC